MRAGLGIDKTRVLIKMRARSPGIPHKPMCLQGFPEQRPTPRYVPRCRTPDAPERPPVTRAASLRPEKTARRAVGDDPTRYLNRRGARAGLPRTFFFAIRDKHPCARMTLYQKTFSKRSRLATRSVAARGLLWTFQLPELKSLPRRRYERREARTAVGVTSPDDDAGAYTLA
jgi:hypothetical protein